MPKELQNEMYARVMEICADLDSLQLGVILESLAKMEADWMEMPEDLQLGLVAKMSLIDQSFRPQTASLENSFHDPYYLPRVIGTLDGCGKIGLTFDRMPLSLQRSLLDFMEDKLLHMDMEFVAKFCFIFARICLRLSDLTEDARYCLTKSIDKYISRFDDKQFAELLSGLSRMDIKMSELPRVTQEGVVQSFENRFHFMSSKNMGYSMKQ
eukprot:gene29923-37056_t